MITTTWEYETVLFETVVGVGSVDANKVSERLNALGAEGWELVTMFDTNMHGGSSRGVLAVLKRPLL